MISLDEVKELASTYNVIPVVKRLFNGIETPIGLYQKLCGERKDTFLLESAEQGVWGRYSFIGVASPVFLAINPEGLRLNPTGGPGRLNAALNPRGVEAKPRTSCPERRRLNTQ